MGVTGTYPAAFAAARLLNGATVAVVWFTRFTAASCWAAVGWAVQFGVTIFIPGIVDGIESGQLIVPAGDAVGSANLVVVDGLVIPGMVAVLLAACRGGWTGGGVR